MTGEACPFCDHLNPEGSRYCNNCGAALYLRPCPHCGELTETAAARCRSCGGELHAADGMPLRNGAAMAAALGEASTGERRVPGASFEAAVDAVEAGIVERVPKPGAAGRSRSPAEIQASGLDAIELSYPSAGDGCARECHTDEPTTGEAVEDDGSEPGSPNEMVPASLLPASHELPEGDARDSLREVFAGAARTRGAVGNAGQEDHGDHENALGVASDGGGDGGARVGGDGDGGGGGERAGGDGAHADTSASAIGGHGGVSPGGNDGDTTHGDLAAKVRIADRKGNGHDRDPVGLSAATSARAVFDLPAPLTTTRRDVVGELQAVAAGTDRATERLARYGKALNPIEVEGDAIREDATEIRRGEALVPPHKPLRKLGVVLLVVGLALSGYGAFRALTGGSGGESGASRSGVIATPGSSSATPDVGKESSAPGREAAASSTPGGDAAVSSAPGREAAVSSTPGREAAVSSMPAREAASASSSIGEAASSSASAERPVAATAPTAPGPMSPSGSKIAVGAKSTSERPSTPPSGGNAVGTRRGAGDERAPPRARTPSEGGRAAEVGRSPSGGRAPSSPSASSTSRAAQAATTSTVRSVPAAGSPPIAPSRAPTQSSRPCTQAVAALGLCDPRSIQEGR